uniref:Glutathione S-transferase n=1 Tax=Timema tahoe TaxID=61484 RepID=A0A7R9NUB4_9NEOP|nr:unnamed protein product [Timema tahoe]
MFMICFLHYGSGGRVGAESDKKMPVIMYFYPASPPCRAAMLVARAVGVDLNSNHTDITSGAQLTPEFIKLNPQHTVPTIDDNGFILSERCHFVNLKNTVKVILPPLKFDSHVRRKYKAESAPVAQQFTRCMMTHDALQSRAIMGYFVNQYAKDDSLYPKDPKKRAMVDQKLYFDIGTLYQRFLNYFMPIAWKGMKPDDEALKKLEEAVGFLNSYLEGQSWVAGEDITIADYAIAVTMSNIEIVLPDLSKYKNVEIWSTKAKAAIPRFDEINLPGVKMFREVYESKKN